MNIESKSSVREEAESNVSSSWWHHNTICYNRLFKLFKEKTNYQNFGIFVFQNIIVEFWNWFTSGVIFRTFQSHFKNILPVLDKKSQWKKLKHSLLLSQILMKLRIFFSLIWYPNLGLILC